MGFGAGSAEAVTLAAYRPGPPRDGLARGHATMRKAAVRSEGGGSERCASMSSEPNLRVSSRTHSLPHAVLPFGGVRRWLMANRVQPVVRPEADEEHAAPQAWWKVMCLTGCLTWLDVGERSVIFRLSGRDGRRAAATARMRRAGGFIDQRPQQRTLGLPITNAAYPG